MKVISNIINPRHIYSLISYDLPLPSWLEHCIEQASLSNLTSNSTDRLKILLAITFDFAFRFHNGQFRATGEPYIIHPLAVANILYMAGASPAVIMAGLLHDIIEDTIINAKHIEINFGSEVGLLVEGVTKLGKIHYTNHTEARAENMHRLFLSMANDIRVVLVKLADRLHNMRTIASLDVTKQRTIARETRDFYIPLANRLGIGYFQWELEDLAFKILEPEVFLKIQSNIAVNRSEREFRINEIVKLLYKHLKNTGLENFSVNGRTKHLYGLWCKMQCQQRAFDEIYDIAGIRIITPTVEGCYRALATIYEIFCPVFGRFKDYIGLPKANGYQSLHTAVIGTHRLIEIQIRTNEMHQMAEYGIASHWRYKEGGSPANIESKYFNWLYQFVDWKGHNEFNEHNNYLSLIKEDLLVEGLYVFTPSGDLVCLSKSATAVDFAYFVHISMGNCFQQVRINGRLCPFNTKLESGDFIQILTGKFPNPSLDWLNFLSTPTPHSQIRCWYKKVSDRDSSIQRGLGLLKRELGTDGIYAIRNNYFIKRIMGSCDLFSLEDLLAALGCGRIVLNHLLNCLRF
uniref:Putative GTP diphosphokinase RSH1, chloroplastic n=1 Tax=Paulinella chromatophora TaxID=39717 RepID=B1X4C0_PAUCH|nr:metal dependent phosphohydrolase [Paulinella chromatophora]ACB42789.1 metal dependent phosphohydrolase [Paulinella chromatophora]